MELRFRWGNDDSQRLLGAAFGRNQIRNLKSEISSGPESARVATIPNVNPDAANAFVAYFEAHQKLVSAGLPIRA